MSTIVKDNAAREAEDAARHGYNGRNGRGAELLKACAKAVRIAAGQVERLHAVPAVSADERAEYTGDLVARLVGDHGGEIPLAADLAPSYLVKRARGLMLNDYHRRTVGLVGNPEQSREGGAPEPCGDDRLDGPLEVTPLVRAIAAELELSETGTRALAAAMIPATREEWAELFGYSSGKAFHVIAWRGRAELVAIGEQAIRDALARVESATAEGGE